MVGGEGRSVRRALRTEADYHVSVSASKRPSGIGVDSLNVSVAAAVLAAEFLRGPEVRRQNRATKAEQEDIQAEGDLGF